MPTTIKLKNSVTTTNAPSSLVQGEVAINITDKKVWVGNAATTPIQLLGDGGSGSFTSIAFGAGTVSSPSITFTGDTNTGIYSPAADTIAFTEGGVESMRIDSSGNVGIGTSSPNAKLVVSGGSEYITNTASNSAGIEIAGNGNTPTTTSLFVGQGSTSLGFVYQRANSDLLFGTNNTERMRITSGGNLLVGTTSDYGAKVIIESGTSTPSTSGNMTTGVVVWAGNGSQALNFGNDGTGAWYNAAFANNAGVATTHRWLTGGTERMRITSGGDLLVGTTGNANNRLRVVGSNAVGRLVAFLGNASGDTGNSSLLISKFDNNSTTSQIFIQFAVNNDTTANGQINANGSGAAAFGSWSDSRLKENIVDLPSQLAKITALRPVEFDYIESEGGGHQIGFIAQEMQEVYPDAVGERADGMLTVTGWSKTEARLVKAIQEQQAMIEELKQEVAKLKGV